MKNVKCPRCGSDNLILVLKVPWSTDGLIPKQQIFFKCQDCGYEFPIKEKQNSSHV